MFFIYNALGLIFILFSPLIFFVRIFLGKEDQGFTKAVSAQRCLRAGGKHNDLENVGYTPRHHTFFEMLGNWSFGDYYKKEAIQWSWELFTDIWKLDKNRLWVTVFEDDDEAYNLWSTETDIDKNRIVKSGAKDNFWEMGETGPCGPCSEIHYYIGQDVNMQSSKGVNSSNEYWELWNLVFNLMYVHVKVLASNFILDKFLFQGGVG